MKMEAILWGAIVAAPLVWFLNLEANFALAPLACSGGKPALYLVSAACLAVAAVAMWVSFTQWRLPENADSHRGAMALAGAGLSGLSLLVILAQAIPTLLLRGCE